jgi:hypothetical protein
LAVTVNRKLVSASGGQASAMRGVGVKLHTSLKYKSLWQSSIHSFLPCLFFLCIIIFGYPESIMPRALVIKQIEGKPGKVYYPYAPHFNSSGFPTFEIKQTNNYLPASPSTQSQIPPQALATSQSKYAPAPSTTATTSYANTSTLASPSPSPSSPTAAAWSPPRAPQPLRPGKANA